MAACLQRRRSEPRCNLKRVASLSQSSAYVAGCEKLSSCPYEGECALTIMNSRCQKLDQMFSYGYLAATKHGA